jgi:hypothetical protein
MRGLGGARLLRIHDGRNSTVRHSTRGRPLVVFSEPWQHVVDGVNGQATVTMHAKSSPPQKQHIINAFRFELSRVQTPAVRERMVCRV